MNAENKKGAINNERYKKCTDYFETRYRKHYKKLLNFLTYSPNQSMGGHRVFFLKGDKNHDVWEHKLKFREGTC
ncbi:unnamed protein product [Rotaria sp. Silwood2]|nr:unnamed protein product [Rotaria sp. Silwood2]CAF4040382.1 unnamed protein product [Rotaria sp. Silwood2]